MTKATAETRPSRSATMRALLKKRRGDRRLDIVEAAAALFAERGYQGASMRDIADQVGLLSGSLYHHFKSKDALFLEIHELALQGAADLIEEAVAGREDPWDRLEAACAQLIEIQLDPHSVTTPLMNDLRAVPPDVRARLVERRDEFETVFTRLVDALPLDGRLDRSLYRVLLLNLINTASVWYRPGRLSPTDIGRQIMLIFRREARAAP
ncbi:TetR/AcrR family transcriptional regulator [Methylocella sp.]|uniref:TetR/AcrR family transcriptional regulator n=1 Tax=Methylocella sp. TaxID=1978226 RepID=UPI003783BEFD